MLSVCERTVSGLNSDIERSCFAAFYLQRDVFQRGSEGQVTQRDVVRAAEVVSFSGGTGDTHVSYTWTK